MYLDFGHRSFGIGFSWGSVWVLDACKDPKP